MRVVLSDPAGPQAPSSAPTVCTPSFLVWSPSHPGLPPPPGLSASPGPDPAGPVPPSLPSDPGPTNTQPASLLCRLLGSVWSFRLGNHKSGLGGGAAETLFWTFSASVFEAQTLTGYRLRIFQQQINTLIRVTTLREVDTDYICALGGRASSKFNYNLSVKYASSAGVSCFVHNYLPALSQSPSYDASVCCERLIYRLVIG